MHTRSPLCFLLAAAATVLSLAAAASPAAALPGAVIAEHAAGAAVADGDATAVYPPTEATVRVLDTRAGTTRDADVASFCTRASGYALVNAVGGGHVLLTCAFVRPQPADVSAPIEQEPVLLPVGGGAPRYVPERSLVELRSSAVSFQAVGTVGIRFVVSAYKGSWGGMLDWRTGAIVRGDGRNDEVPDLDAPSGFRPLCAPIRRALEDTRAHDLGEYYVGGRWNDLLYEPPYALTWGWLTPLTLRRCGDGRETVLRRSGRSLYTAQLAGGVASWQPMHGEGKGRLFAFLPECSVRLSWAPAETNVRVAHLDRELVLSAPAEGLDRDWTITRLPLRHACAGASGRGTATIATAGHRVGVRSRAASWSDRETGATAELLPPAKSTLPRLRLAHGKRIAFRSDRTARRVSVRVGDGRARSARRDGARWTIPAPRLRRPRTISFHVRYADGGTARFALRALPARS